MIVGHATEKETRKRADRQIRQGMPESGFRKLGRTAWTTSLLGFGCYRIDDGTPEHTASLGKALREGCNLIDTSTNYTDGASERCVGGVVSALVGAGELARSEVVIVSKVGYVQGHNQQLAMERERHGRPYPEMVKFTDGCWHCIHPEFIAEQLTLSLQRLQLAQLDVYLLHNPEYFLSDAAKRGQTGSLQEGRAEFYARVRRAFDHLEGEVSAGRIRHYGVSSNTFGSEATDPEATSITRMWDLAREVAAQRHGDAAKHHFSVIQLPTNLFESGPILEKNNGPAHSLSALELAKEKELGVLVNRPLNAMVENQILRLSDFAEAGDLEAEGTTSDCVKRVREMESEFSSKIAPCVQTAPGSVAASDLFRWGQELSNPQLGSLPLEHWSQIESQMVRPQVNYLIQQLEQHLSGGAMADWRSWKARYLPELERLIQAVRRDCTRQSQKVSRAMAQKLDPLLPEAIRAESLSRKAIAVLVNTPGVSCVLNGMRRLPYVDDSLGVLRLMPFPVDASLYRAFKLGFAVHRALL